MMAAKKKKISTAVLNKVIREEYGSHISSKEIKRLLGSEALGSAIRRANEVTRTATVTTGGRGRHVGLKLPKTTNKQRVEQLRKARKKKRGTVRAVKRRK
jgi:hypothetical protein